MGSSSGSRTLPDQVADWGASSDVQVALRVLIGWMDGQAPSLEDVNFLQSFKPELKHLPVDELACVVMAQHNHTTSPCVTRQFVP